jgi:hypothetical protein
MKRVKADDGKTPEQIAHEAIFNFCVYSGLDFDFVRSPYFQAMLDAIALHGPGFKGPSAEALKGRILVEAVQDENNHIAELRTSWAKTGCTIMSHGWTDSANRTIFDILVYCPRGTAFLQSVDASEQVKSALLLFELFESIVLEVGVQHVVQFVSDNASSNFVAAGRLLMDKYPTLFWIPSVADYLDLILEDIGKIEWVKVILDKAKSITRYIYNHVGLHNLMREHTGNKEIAHLVPPVIPRFATNFILLQSLCAYEKNLQRMLLSDKWKNSNYSKTADGKGIEKLVFHYPFWRDADEVIAISEPLVKVLRMVDGDKAQMGYIYEAQDTAQKSIRAKFQGRDDDCLSVCENMDFGWQLEFYRPLHAAGYYLNPAFFYDKSLHVNVGLTEGLFQCIERMSPDDTTRVSIVQQLQEYKNASGLFGSAVVIRLRKIVSPSLWWENFGSETPDLQKFAVRVLSQICNASRCEHSWTMKNLHSKKRNRLAQKRMNDLVFVQYNLRLRHKQLEGSSSVEVIPLLEVDPFSEWIVETEESTFRDEDLSWIDSDGDIDNKSDSKSLTSSQSVAGSSHSCG